MLTVTRLEPQKKNPQRLNVYLDGEFAFGISRAAAPWLAVGEQLSQQKVEDLKNSDQAEIAYQRALHFLSYRSRSEQEIRQNLSKHKIPEEIINEVLDKLRQSSLVDDRAFARNWIENRSQFKPRGRRALSSELTRKGIAREIIDEELHDLDESLLALQCARKKAGRYQQLDQENFLKKMTAYLNRRGFPYQTTRDAAMEIWQELHKAS
jgi:regulatory protein